MPLKKYVTIIKPDGNRSTHAIQEVKLNADVITSPAVENFAIGQAHFLSTVER